jgi:hypothetical protein
MATYTLHDILYRSGDLFLPDSVNKFLSTDLIGSSRDTFYISGWSILHFLSGVFIGFFYLFMKWNVRTYILNMFVLHTMWECWQILIGMSRPYTLTGRGNLMDTVVDTVLFMIGAYIALFVTLSGKSIP